MNKKIHNNLNIENLIKTNTFNKLTINEKESLLQNSQWFNQFDEFQQEEISRGIKNNLNISIYAKREFNAAQMREIIEGLERNLNISIYAKPEYDWGQMKEIRLGLERKIDVSVYAKSEVDWSQMKEIRKKLENEQKNI